MLGTWQALIIAVLTMCLLNVLLDLGLANYCLQLNFSHHLLSVSEVVLEQRHAFHLHSIFIYTKPFGATK